MERRYFLLAVGSAAGTLLATDSCSSTGSFFSSPFPRPPNQAIALTARYAKTTIAGYTLRTRTYDGKTHGPIVETHPGQTLSFEIINDLPKNPPEKVPASALVPWYHNEMEAMGPSRRRPRKYRLSTDIDKDNNPHGFNTTNLHVHGIQTVPHLFKPIGTSDPAAMMLEIEPGKRFRYDFPIPPDHPSGLFWYHPHKHGSSDVQISGGMAGLIVVRGAIDAVPEIAAAREIFMVVQTLDVNESATDPHVYEREYKAYKTPAEGGYNDETEFTMMTVNGQGVNWIRQRYGRKRARETPEFAMAPGEVVRLRLLNGTGYYALALALPEFEPYQIGFDGINLLEATKKDMSGNGVTIVDPTNVFDADPTCEPGEPHRAFAEGAIETGHLYAIVPCNDRAERPHKAAAEDGPRSFRRERQPGDDEHTYETASTHSRVPADPRRGNRRQTHVPVPVRPEHADPRRIRIPDQRRALRDVEVPDVGASGHVRRMAHRERRSGERASFSPAHQFVRSRRDQR